MIWLWLILAFLAGLFFVPAATLLSGFVAGFIWQWRKIRERKP